MTPVKRPPDVPSMLLFMAGKISQRKCLDIFSLHTHINPHTNPLGRGNRL
jgi:hypothetical protein